MSFFPRPVRRRALLYRASAERRQVAEELSGQGDQSTVYHFFRANNPVKLFRREKTELQTRFFQRETVVMRMLGDSGCVVITDCGAERCYEHQGAVDKFGDPFFIGFESLQCVFCEAVGINDEKIMFDIFFAK